MILLTLDCKEIHYKSLITTMPLDVTLRMVGRPELASQLKYSSSYIIGLGVRGNNPFDNKCWLYYPEANCPFYRCTIFSHYAQGNCPNDNVLLPTIRLADGAKSCSNVESRPGPYHSFMFEVSESAEHKPVDASTIVEETIQGAMHTRLINPDSEIVSIFYKRLDRGYPTPFLERDAVLDEALSYLREHDVWSRGRFGSWKYEVSE
jgi:protoporphyrinogen oxidase